MKNKAFTLIELLAVITILAVVITIAIPSISNSLSNSYQNAYELDLGALEKAAKDYVLRTNMRIDIDVTKKVTISQMMKVSLIKEVLDPKTKEECEGYVAITNNGNKYLYVPYLKCGTNYISDDFEQDDITKPIITILGNNPVNINVNGTYTDTGATATDDMDGNLTSKITSISTLTPSVVGSYAVKYSVFDNSGNEGTATRTVNVIDSVAPTVAFGTNGSSTYAKTRSTIVTVTDAHTDVDTSSLEYQWTSSTTAPTEASFTNAFTSGGTITSPSSITGLYYLWILAKDTSGNMIVTRTNAFYLDNTTPLITIAGTNPITISAGSTYTDAGATATDAHSGLSGSVTSSSTLNPNAIGTYTITYSASDNAGNTATATRTVNVTDTTAPTIAFGTNGNSTYAKTRSTTVTSSDQYGTIIALKYLWSTSTTTLTESSFASGTTFSNGNAITSPAGANGLYYLWILSKDNSNNINITRTNAFYLDNAVPVITMTGSNPMTVSRGGTYTDPGATATDTHSGVNGSVTSTGTVNPATIGTYTVTYNVSDNAGNAATPVVRTVNVVDATAPVITIIGSTQVNLEIKSTYTDAGATALDDMDGNLTSSITTTSDINPFVLGTYAVTYRVSDSKGNQAIATRTINVIDSADPTISFASAGSMLLSDPTFASGTNGTTVYNNLGNGTVSIARTSISGAPEGSGYGLTITTTGTPSPGWGGFYFATPTAANKTFVTRIVAKIPVGYTINWASNQLGTGSSSAWLTSQAGTGTWQEYIFRVYAGATGTFSSTNFFYLTGGTAPTAGSPLVWQVAYATVFDSSTWGYTNNVVATATDDGAGITGYGINQSSTVAPTFTTISTRNELGAVTSNITANGTYYLWVRDAAGNTANRAVTVSYVDRTGPTIAVATAGSMIYSDPTFVGGLNGISLYNNSGDGTVTLSGIAISGAPEGSGNGIEIRTTAGTSSPGWGGFYFGNMTAANKTYITRIVAKIPVGYTINWASNQLGTGNSPTWLTSQAGTGTWQEYIFRVYAGATGTFSSTNFFYLTGGTTPTAGSPLVWQVAYATVFDTTLWSGSNYVVFTASDTVGINGYGINQSSVTAPSFTTVSTRTPIGGVTNGVTTPGTYYLWTRDTLGNTSNQAVSVSYIDGNAPTITANSTSYSIAQLTSNALPGTYFSIVQNGSAPISTTCVDTSNGNITVTNTSSLAVGSHIIRCTTTKTNGMSSTATTTITVNTNAYTIGQALAYAGMNWHVLKINGSNVTLLADWGTISAKQRFDTTYNPSYPSCTYSPSGYCGNNVWATAQIKTYLNTTWLNSTSLSTSNLVDEGYGYIRLISNSEYSTLKSQVGSPTWLHSATIGWWYTMTAASQYMVCTVTDAGAVSTLMEAFDSAYARPVITIK